VDNPQLVEDLQTLQAFGFTTVRLAGDVQLGAQAALGLIGSGLELAYQEGARAIVTGAGALSSADLSALLEAGDVWVDDQMRGLLKLAAAEVLNTLPLATLQSWAEQGAQGVFLVGDTVQTGLDQARIFVTAGLDVVGQPGRLQDIIDDGVRIALLEASDLADLAAAGFDRLIATGGDMTLDLAAALEASASGLALDALNGVVAVKVSAQDMASLTVDQIAALGRIGVETFDSVGEVLINPDQYLAAAQAGLHWGKLWGESLIFMVGLQHPQLLAAAAELKAFGVTTVRFLGDVPVTAAVALGLIGSGLGLAYEQGARAIISGAETLSPDNLSALMDAGMDWASDQTLGLLKLAAVEARKASGWSATTLSLALIAARPSPGPGSMLLVSRVDCRASSTKGPALPRCRPVTWRPWPRAASTVLSPPAVICCLMPRTSWPPWPPAPSSTRWLVRSASGLPPPRWRP
jgi:hypothetical protein